MDLASNFKVVLFSHVGYRNLTAEIYFGDDFVALVSREKGTFQIEWAPLANGLERRYDLDALLGALAVAKERLAECVPATSS